MNKLMALIAFLILGGFVAILGIWVPSPDLLAVIVLTLGLVGYDFYVSTSKPKD